MMVSATLLPLRIFDMICLSRLWKQVKKQFLRVRKAAAEIGEDGIQMYLGL